MTAIKLKPLQDGKLSFVMPKDLREILIRTVYHRVQNETVELEHHTYFALLEAHSRMVRQMGKKRISLLCSHFYTVFSTETMAYLDEGTQNLIYSHLHDLGDPPPRLLDTNISYDYNDSINYPHDWSKHYEAMTKDEVDSIPI